MSMIALVMSSINATRTEVVRVLNHGVRSDADWAIAHAIEKVSGQSAYELMMLAGREAEVAEIWADSRPQDPEPVAVEPSLAPDVTVYAEDANELVTDIPESRPRTPEDEDEPETVEGFAARVYSDLDDLLRRTLRSTGRLVRSWGSLSQARRETAVLVNQARARRRAECRSRTLTLAA